MSDRREMKARQNALARRAKAGDRQALADLMRDMEGLVIQAVAARARVSRVSREDMKAQARLGILEALQVYDPDRLGADFPGLAGYHVLSALERQDMTMGGPASQDLSKIDRRLRYKLGARVRYREAEGYSEGRALELAARDLGVSPDRAASWLASRQAGPGLGAGGDEGAGYDPADEAPHVSEAIHAAGVQLLVQKMFADMSPRHQQVAMGRYVMEPAMSQDALAAELGVSRRRVSQLEAEVLGLLRVELDARGLTLSDLL